MLRDHDEVSFSIESSEISGYHILYCVKSQLVSGLLAELGRNESNQFSTSSPSVSQMTVTLF